MLPREKAGGDVDHERRSDAEAENDVPDGYMWVTLRQLNQLLRYGHVNIEARSLLSCLSLI